MPPKAQGGGAAKKAEQKKAAKVVEDKTFGLKNKNKSKKVQQYVQSVKKQVDHMVEQRIAGKGLTEEQRRAEEAKKMKAEQAKMEKELALLFKQSIKQPPVPPGVDPKSIVCEFFKHGCCDKGAKCKYAHDLTVQKKSAKLDLYSDRRDGGEGGAEEGKEEEEKGMSDWDQAKLEQVVKTKHGAEAGKSTKTEIVCKFFLDAIEKEQYGWFWICPAGGDACKYRHALPPGYVFKSKAQREAELQAKLDAEANAGDITESIEEQRAKLPSTGLTPVTAETFSKWKAERDARKAAEKVARQEEEAKKGSSGMGRDFKVLSGRTLFAMNAELFQDDENADADVYSDDGGQEEGDGEGAEGAGAAAELPVGDADAFLEGDDDLDDLDDDDEEEEEDEEGEGGGEEDEEAAEEAQEE